MHRIKGIVLPRKILDREGTCCLYASAVMVAMYWRTQWEDSWNLPVDVDAPEWNELIDSYERISRQSGIGVTHEEAIDRFIRKHTPLSYKSGFKSEDTALEELQSEISRGIPNIGIYDDYVFRGKIRYEQILGTPAENVNIIKAYHAVVVSKVEGKVIYVYDSQDLRRRTTTPMALETFIDAWAATKYRCGVLLPSKARRAVQRRPSVTLLKFMPKRESEK